jgi:thiosulfate dehydrogenase (quinone) large subunit
MFRSDIDQLSVAQRTSLVVLRTLIGWHFLYEAYYKIALPGWSNTGTPLGRWTSAGYLRAASGPIGRLFQRLIENGWIGWIDNAVKIGLLLIGLSLILGLYTRLGATAAFLLLILFYVVAIPLAGIQQPGSEGAYLVVNKTLIEAAAVSVLLFFNTGQIAGLDLLLRRRRSREAAPAADSAMASAVGEGKRV